MSTVGCSSLFIDNNKNEDPVIQRSSLKDFTKINTYYLSPIVSEIQLDNVQLDSLQKVLNRTLTERLSMTNITPKNLKLTDKICQPAFSYGADSCFVLTIKDFSNRSKNGKIAFDFEVVKVKGQELVFSSTFESSGGFTDGFQLFEKEFTNIVAKFDDQRTSQFMNN
jgi:hypothetical protein